MGNNNKHLEVEWLDDTSPETEQETLQNVLDVLKEEFENARNEIPVSGKDRQEMLDRFEKISSAVSVKSAAIIKVMQGEASPKDYVITEQAIHDIRNGSKNDVVIDQDAQGLIDCCKDGMISLDNAYLIEKFSEIMGEKDLVKLKESDKVQNLLNGLEGLLVKRDIKIKEFENLYKDNTNPKSLNILGSNKGFQKVEQLTEKISNFKEKSIIKKLKDVFKRNKESTKTKESSKGRVSKMKDKLKKSLGR